MTVAREVAVVYRGGRRRWFTLQAAMRAEARAHINRHCECEPPESDHIGVTYRGSQCRYHDGSDHWRRVSDRLIRRWMRAGRKVTA